MSGDSKNSGDDGHDLLSKLLDLEDNEATQLLDADAEGQGFETKTAVDSILPDGQTAASQTVDRDLELFDDLNGLTDLVSKEDFPPKAKTPPPAPPRIDEKLFEDD